jgi:hypothetical protein
MHRVSSHVPSSLAGLVAAAVLVTAPGCAAMHKQQVANLRAQGQHQRAACYEVCAPSDLACLKQCDTSHPLEVDPRLAQYAQIAAAAVAVDAAKAAPAATTQSVPASGSSAATSSSSSSSSSQRSLEINGHTYTGGDRLGQPCTLDAPCPDGYTCHLVTNRSGQCVQ